MNHYQPLLYWLAGYEAVRKRALQKAPLGALKDYLSTPLPSPANLMTQVQLLAVDFETTGLNATQDKLLSIGCVELTHRHIQLASAHHQIINTQIPLAASNVVIHQITDQQQAQGSTLKAAIDTLLHALAGKVMLVHFARIEQQFLQQACLTLYGIKPPLAIIDTLVLAKRRLDRRDVAYDPASLRLGNLREHYHLPHYSAHNALNDAIATAELYLAQTAQLSAKTRLSELLY